MKASARALPRSISWKPSPGPNSGRSACKRRSVTRPGLALTAYLAASRAIPLVAPMLLRRRLARGKELPDRWQEKLGQPTQPRPDGPLIWLHAVGLGETLALRGLIAAMAEQAPAAEFLVTSTTRASAEVLAANLPPRTRHQFLPLDAPRYLARFLDHWRPALSVWAEQDLWPGAVAATDSRGIPLALVNARMNADAFARRARWASLYADLFARFRLICAQDQAQMALGLGLDQSAQKATRLSLGRRTFPGDVSFVGSKQLAHTGIAFFEQVYVLSHEFAFPLMFSRTVTGVVF